MADPYDILNAKFLGVSLDISSQDSIATALTFSNDGLKMFMLGSGNDDLFQYNLTAPFDLSTASFSGISFDFSTENIGATAVDFSADGLKMFMLGTIGDILYEYNLTTAFDLLTATFSGKMFDVTSEDTTPRDFKFSTDGFKLFYLGNEFDSIFEYNLTTAFDLNTISFSGNSFNVNSEDPSPRGISFSVNGLQLFYVGSTNDKVHEYTLTTAFDITTASFSGNSFDLSNQDTSPRAVEFSSDGLRMFMLGVTNDTIYEYIIISGIVVDHNRNIQRIIDRIKDDPTLFDNGDTVGKFREVIFGNPDNDDKIAITQKPALYITTKDSIQNTRYNFGYLIVDNQSQVTVEYELVLLAAAKTKTEPSQKQLYELMKNIHLFVSLDPRFTIPLSQSNPGTDPIFARSVINSVKWDSKTRGQLVTSVSFTLLATIGIAFSANFPGIGDVILLSKPNAPEGIVFSEDREQTFPNRVLTEYGDFGSLDVEYESTVALDNSFRTKFGVEEDITITTASGNKIYHIKYISINPTAQFDAIERTILHMEIIPV